MCSYAFGFTETQMSKEHLDLKKKLEEEAAAKAKEARGILSKKNNQLKKKLANVKSRLFATSGVKGKK